ncbi:c-type cytochrome [Postechiella marina]|uniref:C-type cytochrome n=1 Tax=Postechiella marina TaxID=943941 RepID=A0ABP8CBF7_9FLAO
MKLKPIVGYAFLFCIALTSCNNKPKKPTEIPLTIIEDSLVGEIRAIEAKKTTTAKVGDGLVLSLWASDSLAPDPVSMDIDENGRVFMTRTNRQKNSEFDIRGHRNWMTPSISWQTVEDRRKFLYENFATNLSTKNTWLKDLNNDSIHDWKDLTIEKDEVWMLEDTDGNGIADKSTRILNDFNNEVDDVAGALLVKGDNLYVGIAPNMWKIKDSNDDGVFDEKTSLANGFGIHVGFGGHGMSGAIEGPDGKIYWGIGDIGANLTDNQGNTYKYPNQGVIVRCNPDGSNFEIVARGLRNTHEFVFDAYGNIITSDNDGDHKGETERLIYIVEGHDAGWRANWQYGKYTDPKNNEYKVWMDEELFKPRWDGQAAYIIPPIANFHGGPTGMAFNPGTGLGIDWLNSFFLVQFSGAPNRSHVWNFTLKPKGASFVLDKDESILNGILATGLRFGPDGALYMTDWINGWKTKNLGRVWKLDVEANKNDLKNARLETQKLITLDYKKQSISELTRLLSYIDMRIRKKAQFELVKRGTSGYNVFKEVIINNTNQFARIHAIWGIGQISDSKQEKASPLLDLLTDSNPEIIAQAAKILGDVKHKNASSKLIPLLKHDNARVRFFAAQALGRLKHKEAVKPLLKMLEENNDEDVYIRHAGVLALYRIGEILPITALVKSPNKSLRLAAVLILRKFQSKDIAKFLNDEDNYIVTETARAINDDWSIKGALPALAQILTNKRFKTSEPLLRRAINAALRVGSEKDLNNLLAFAKRTDVSGILRSEALATISSWTSPSVLDRVDGRYRGEIKRDANTVKSKIEKEIPHFLNDKDPNVLAGIAEVLITLQIDSYNDKLFHILKTNPSTIAKSAALKALGNLNFKSIESAVQLGMKNKGQNVRSTAIALIKKLNISKERLPEVIEPIFKYGTINDQQTMLNTLGELPVENTEHIFKSLINKAKNKKISKSITLDLIEAVEKTKSKTLITKLSSIRESSDFTESYKDVLYGGNARKGRQIFHKNSTAQCVRCHVVAGGGGKVGPNLDNIGNTLTREQLLEALIEPSKRLAPGFGNVVLTLDDGQVVTGVLAEEKAHELIITTSEAEPLDIPISRIKKRENMPSSMPPMGKLIKKRELRDVIQYLSTLKK